MTLAHHLAIVTADYPPLGGGMSRFTAGLARALPAQEWNVTVVAPETFTAGPTPPEEIPVFRYSGAGTVVRRAARVLRVLFKLGPANFDALLATTWSPPGIACAIAAALWNKPYFIVAHGKDILEPRRSRRWKTLMRLVLGQCAGIAAVSRYTAEQVAGLGIAREKITVLPNGIDPRPFADHLSREEARAKLDLAPGQFTFLTVARLERHKAVDCVLRALSFVETRLPRDWKYLVLGDGGRQEAYLALAEQLKLSRHVEFRGYVPDEQLPSYYRAADVFVLTSREMPETGDVEGFGIVFLEAGAAGLPVIATRAGGIPDAVADGESGMLVEPDNPSALAGKLLELAKDGSLRARLGRRGRQRVLDEFAWDKLGARWSAWLEGRLGPARGGRAAR